MVLLFVVGVMNLFWVAAITLFVLIEKIAPWDGIWDSLPAQPSWVGVAGSS